MSKRSNFTSSLQRSFVALLITTSLAFSLLSVRGETHFNLALAWDKSAGVEVSSYNLYIKSSSGQAERVHHLSSAAFTVVTNLVQGQDYTFRVTAIGAKGIESGPSIEVSYASSTAAQLATLGSQVPGRSNPSNGGAGGNGSNPAPTTASPKISQSRFTPQADGSLTVQFQTTPNHTCLVQASTDLTSWRSVGQVTSQNDGQVSFTDADAGQVAQRFYRLVLP